MLSLFRLSGLHRAAWYPLKGFFDSCFSLHARCFVINGYFQKFQSNVIDFRQFLKDQKVLLRKCSRTRAHFSNSHEGGVILILGSRATIRILMNKASSTPYWKEHVIIPK